MEGFSGFTRQDWDKAKDFMGNNDVEFDADNQSKKTFFKNLKKAINYNTENIPCTKDFSDTKNTSWEYQSGDQKNCPPFQPKCEIDSGKTIGVCTGNIKKPMLKVPADKTFLRNSIKDNELKSNGYCTGVFSTCGDGGVCNLNNNALSNSWGKNTYTEIIATAKLENTPSVRPHIGRKISDPKCKEACVFGERCGKEGICIKQTSLYSSGGDNVVSTERINDGVSALSSEELRIRNLTANDTKKLKENNANFLEEGSLKKWNLTKGGGKASEIKTNSFRNSIDILKTKYIWSFNLPVNVINSILRLPSLSKINLGLKTFLLETKQREDFKKAVLENNEDKDIQISYNKRAIVTALYKLSKKQSTYGEKNWSKIINDEWIEKRTFKTTNTCSGNICTGNLTLKNLDTNKIPWGYKSRKAFKKKAPGTTDSWDKLGDTSDVGKHLYGNTGVRNIFNTVNPHPHQNDFIFLKK